MELAELEIFRAVAQEQSVTRAARVLDRVQSNVTTRLKQLEDDLGVLLFQREGRRMSLTPAGQRLLGYAERMLALAEEARQSLREDAPSGVLRLGTMESAAAARLPRPLARFHAAWPDVRLDIRTGTAQALVDAVVEHQLDCAVVAHPGRGSARSLSIDDMGPGLEATFLFTEDLMLVLPANHPRVRRPQDVRLRTLAGFARGCTYRQCALEWLAQADESLRDSFTVREMPSYHAILACVTAGSAAAILPRSLLDLHRDAIGDVQTVPVRQAHTFLVRRAGFTTSAYQALLHALRHE
ncbi:DNA-binding transcriptional LysR family regulator [Cupriavidus gilardii J11]|uniref:DNA-binding transcriptional LysR family regulator n=1 Tax=Cupriavidus gilardii J11 TaxID=936133 RepID=A0A562BLI6_9BURK|nr:LysR substrate-binding domain-containing protein [Cupriavidus gilardii]TWG86036.1 DNA-binding transcriptional LysR family regulator [Cupriavidus gilardii J11]